VHGLIAIYGVLARVSDPEILTSGRGIFSETSQERIKTLQLCVPKSKRLRDTLHGCSLIKSTHHLRKNLRNKKRRTLLEEDDATQEPLQSLSSEMSKNNPSKAQP